MRAFRFWNTLWMALAIVLASCDDEVAGSDGGQRADAAVDSGALRDGGTRHDGGSLVDGGGLVDGGRLVDGGGLHDGGPPLDVIGPTITAFIPSGPITLTSGMTIEGLHITSTTGPCIRGSNVSNVRITNNRIGPCAPDANGNGIALERAHDVRIDHNYFDDIATGFYMGGFGEVGQDNLVFDHNRVERVRGPRARGQMVQFNQVNGSGNRVVCNISDQTTPGYLAGPEDHISMFGSSGTPDSPIFVAYNKLRGGGPSQSGGGALAGDYGGSYVTIQGNILVNPGQYGLAIAGGTHHRILDNIVYSPDSFEWSNVGMVVWGQGDTTDPSTCNNHEVRRNRVAFRHRDGYPNGAWNAGNCGPVAGWEDDNDFTDTMLTAAVWDTVIPACL